MESASILQPEDALLQDVPIAQTAERAPRFYRPELDVLRFGAFLAVFIHHGIYTALPMLSVMGGFGLSAFFFLSAFLITELLQRELDVTGSIAIRHFYVRRILRIWPLYFGILVCAVLAGLVFPSYRVQPLLIASYALMLGNVYIGRYGFPVTFICYLWSISVEEQFYLVWPLVNRRFTRRTLTFAAAALIPIASVTVLILAANGATPALGIWTNSIVQFQIFALGGLTGLALRGRIPRFTWPSRVLLLAGGCLLWVTAAAFSGIDGRVASSGYAPMAGYWLVGAGCVCFLLSALGIERRLIPSSLVYLGKISYGLYVFHQISLEIAFHILNRTQGMDSATHHTIYGASHLVLGFALTLTFAALSYRYIELPFLHLKDRFTVVRSRVA